MYLQNRLDPLAALPYSETCRSWTRLISESVQWLMQVYAKVDQAAAAGGGSHHAAPLTLAKHIMHTADGISILVEKGAGISAAPLMHGLFESRLALEYILKENSINRGLAYLVSHIHGRIRQFRIQDPKTPDGEKFLRDVKSDPEWEARLTQPNELPETIAELETVLAREEFAPIEAEWQKTKAALKVEPNWYTLFAGPKSLGRLARALGQYPVYATVYNLWPAGLAAGSVAMADDALLNFGTRADSKQPTIPVRFPRHLQKLTLFTTRFTVEAANLLLDAYIPDLEVQRPLRESYDARIERSFSNLAKSGEVLNITMR